jgi:phage head maturation protease
MEERFKAEVTPVEIASSSNGSGRYTFRGVASTIGNVDRMRRVFLPGAWGAKKIKVPLLYNHQDDDPENILGSSVLTPKGDKLVHESSLNPRAPRAALIQSLIEDGDIPSTSISWVSDDQYFGWSHLQRDNPQKAKEAASLGIPKAEDVTYFARAVLAENSVVIVPANDRALIGAASLLGAERGMVESMREVAALGVKGREVAVGARNSTGDQRLIQTAHDALRDLGATCSLPPGAEFPEDEPASEEKTPPEGIKGGWGKEMVDASADDAVVEQAAQWTTSFINDLPDSSFLYIEDGGKKDADGRTTPRSLRHFPYKDASGKVDLPHLRNALARIPQSSLPASVKQDIQAKAERIAKQNGVGDGNQSAVPTEFEALGQELAELATRF